MNVYLNWHALHCLAELDKHRVNHSLQQEVIDRMSEIHKIRERRRWYGIKGNVVGLNYWHYSPSKSIELLYKKAEFKVPIFRNCRYVNGVHFIINQGGLTAFKRKGQHGQE